MQSSHGLFDALDVDGNGEVDSREWGKAVRSHAETMAKFVDSKSKSKGRASSIGKKPIRVGMHGIQARRQKSRSAHK